MSLNRKDPGGAGPAPRRARLAGRLGVGALVFFTAKGLVWLAVGGFAVFGAAEVAG